MPGMAPEVVEALMRISRFFLGILVCAVWLDSHAIPAAQGATVEMASWALNVNGDIFTSGSRLPDYVDGSRFDWETGTGTISMIYTPVSACDCSVLLFLDHELDQTVNTFHNEFAVVHGSPLAGQSYEIDEPDYRFGNIYHNFRSGHLDNQNSITSDQFPLGEDVSMAMGWNFVLSASDRALMEFYVGENEPVQPFFLSQYDPDSNAAIFFSSSLDIVPVPVPSSIFLLCGGLMLVLRLRRRKFCSSRWFEVASNQVNSHQ